MRQFFKLFAAWALLSTSLSWGAHAQSFGSLVSGDKKAAPTVAAASDPLKRTTPRSAIHGFLEACHDGDYLRAAQYLDLRHLSAESRVTEGPELARQLSRLLDRNPRFEVSRLSDSPEGNRSDGLPPNAEALARFQVNGESVTLHLERASEDTAGAVWVVSSSSIAQIPELSAKVQGNGIEKHIPTPLVDITFAGTALWIWLALILVALVLSSISRWLSRLFIAALKPLTKRYAKSFHTQRLEALTEPMRMILSVIVFRACLPFFPPSALVRDDILKLLTLLFALGTASLIMRLVDVASDTYTARLDMHERALTYSILPLGIRFAKILVFCLAVLFVLEQWGYNTSAILAGVGVGGVAVALAAQKTIENLFGGVSLISDRPVLVGDFCQFGGQVGTVEDIGLRSTRIRTLNRTLVTVPNSQFSTMTLENFSKRDRMWFHPTLRLRRDTTPEQLKQMMAAITDILEQHELVDASGVPMRFTNIAAQSLDLEVFAYVLTPDFNVFLQTQTELLMLMLEASYKLRIGFAVPFQEDFNVSVDPTDNELPHPFQAFQRSNRTGASSNHANANVPVSSPRV